VKIVTIAVKLALAGARIIVKAAIVRHISQMTLVTVANLINIYKNLLKNALIVRIIVKDAIFTETVKNVIRVTI